MKLKITSVTEKILAELSILLAEYQAFYKAKPDHNHNLKFLKSVLDKDDGKFFIGKYNGQNIGYASIYFSYSSVTAKRIAILNDLYVRENFRGRGLGKELINFAISYAKDMKIEQVRWFTRINNTQAQSLYAKYNATKTDWFHYDLDAGKIE